MNKRTILTSLAVLTAMASVTDQSMAAYLHHPEEEGHAQAPVDAQAYAHTLEVLNQAVAQAHQNPAQALALAQDLDLVRGQDPAVILPQAPTQPRALLQDISMAESIAQDLAINRDLHHQILTPVQTQIIAQAQTLYQLLTAQAEIPFPAPALNNNGEGE